MTDECVYYVYAHYKPNEDTPFYIGKGSGKRWLDKQYRSEWWKNIVKKYGFISVKLMENLSHEEAIKEEAKLIREYGRQDIGTGCLVNLTDGMDGNAKLSQETKRKMSQSALGRKWSDERKKRFSEIKKEYYKTHAAHNKGKPHSEKTKKIIGEKSKQKVFSDDYRKKLSNATKGKHNPRAQFYEVNGKIFHTRSEMEDYFGLCFATINKRFTVTKLGNRR